jgi:hypothetical protein
MTPAESPSSPPTGPFIAAALICERVLQEKDGVLSVIRIIDQLSHTIVASSMPEELPKVPYNLTFLITFKSGRGRGRHNVALTMEDPSGMKKQLFAQSIQLEGENRGANLVIQSNITFSTEGIYWFDVLLEQETITRIPFKVIYQLVSPGVR